MGTPSSPRTISNRTNLSLVPKDEGRNVPTAGRSIKSVVFRLDLSTNGNAGSLPGVVQAPGPQESNVVVMDVRLCPTDPVAESRTVLQSNLQQSMTDGEGGRAVNALAERRGSSGLGGACATNNINLGWLKEGLSGSRGQTSGATCFRRSSRKYAISET
jgi:hypothetical protein